MSDAKVFEKDNIRIEIHQGVKGDTGKPLTFADLTPEQKLELKGEKGDHGDKGDKGDMPTAEEVANKLRGMNYHVKSNEVNDVLATMINVLNLSTRNLSGVLQFSRDPIEGDMDVHLTGVEGFTVREAGKSEGVIFDVNNAATLHLDAPINARERYFNLFNDLGVVVDTLKFKGVIAYIETVVPTGDALFNTLPSVPLKYASSGSYINFVSTVTNGEYKDIVSTYVQKESDIQGQILNDAASILCFTYGNNDSLDGDIYLPAYNNETSLQYGARIIQDSDTVQFVDTTNSRYDKFLFKFNQNVYKANDRTQVNTFYVLNRDKDTYVGYAYAGMSNAAQLVPIKRGQLAVIDLRQGTVTVDDGVWTVEHL